MECNVKYGFIKWFCKEIDDVACCSERLNICDRPFIASDSLNVDVSHIVQVIRSEVSDALTVKHTHVYSIRYTYTHCTFFIIIMVCLQDSLYASV